MSTQKEETSSQSINTMDGWFCSAKTTPAERDAMSAKQLEYRFQGDNLGSIWWVIFQALGFKFNGITYKLPDSAPSHCKSKSYSGAELYAEMDVLAIPQLTSVYEDFPTYHKPGNMTFEQRESYDWWRSIREESIFRRFRPEIEGFQLNQIPAANTGSSSTDVPKTLSASTKKRKASTKDAGAEFYLHKKKNSRSSSDKKKFGDAQPTSSIEVVFPTIQEYAKDASENLNMEDVEREEKMHAASFDEWEFQTTVNHSLLLYGVGSKRMLLNQFAAQMKTDGAAVMVVDGFHKDVTIEGILDQIVNIFLRKEKLSYSRYDIHVGRDLHLRSYGFYCFPAGDPLLVNKASSIARALARRVMETKRPFYFILHNIDGAGLRNATAQEALAVLVSHSITSRGLNAVRLLASVDHINSPALLWDSSTCAQFRWIWKPVHTYRPHIEEVTHAAFADEMTASKVLPRHRRGNTHDAADTQHKAIFTVLESLAPRHTETLQQLAGLQSDQLAAAARKNPSKTRNRNQPPSSLPSWVQYKTLLKQCRHKCVVNADDQLRRYLQELQDHGVVEQSDSGDAEMLSYRIPHDTETLKDILELKLKPS